MFRAPSFSGLPPVSYMLDDIPAPLHVIARHLGVSLRTLQRYRTTGNAPRAVMLALFWETRWGRSAADTEAANAASTFAAHAKRQQEHASRMAGIVWRLETELQQAQQKSGHGAANLPVWRVG